MLSTEVTQQSMLQRIESVVSLLMEERLLFKEELEFTKIVHYLYDLIQEHLTHEQFHQLSEQDLKETFSFIMATEIMSTLLDDLTSEQIAIFDELVKRK